MYKPSKLYNFNFFINVLYRYLGKAEVADGGVGGLSGK